MKKYRDNKTYKNCIPNVDREKKIKNSHDVELQTYREIYSDTSNWLKFIEAKITVFLTFETSCFYFTMGFLNNELTRHCYTIYACGLFLAILSIFILCFALLPKNNPKNKNPLYYGSWNGNVDGERYVTVNDYKDQIRDLAIIIDKKSKFLIISLSVYFVSHILLWGSNFLGG